jgi:phosphoglycolate phosphatase
MAAVIFDLDGTLVDSAPDIHAAVNLTLAEEGKEALTLPQVVSFIGNGVPVLIERVMHARGEPPDAARHKDLHDRFMRHYNADPATLSTLYPGAEAALRGLVAAGWKVGLCTNKPQGPSREILQSFGVLGLFAIVIGGDSLPVKKPDPAPLRAAAAPFAGGPVVYVGDSEVDAATAVAAGLPFVLFTEGYRKTPVDDLPHHARFSHFDELPPLLETLARV